MLNQDDNSMLHRIRGAQIAMLNAHISGQLGADVPVLLVGDFNLKEATILPASTEKGEPLPQADR